MDRGRASSTSARGCGSLTCPKVRWWGSWWKAGSFHSSVSRVRMMRPLYRELSVRGVACARSYGPSRDCPAAIQTPLSMPAACRNALVSEGRQEKIRVGRPLTSSTWVTSSWAKPWPGGLSGSRSSQLRRSGDQAWPTTPRRTGGTWRRHRPARSPTPRSRVAGTSCSLEVLVGWSGYWDRWSQTVVSGGISPFTC